MPAEDGIALLQHAVEAEETERMFERWVNGYQHMSFDAFRAELMPKPEKSAADILNDVSNIMQAWEVTRSHGNL